MLEDLKRRFSKTSGPPKVNLHAVKRETSSLKRRLSAALPVKKSSGGDAVPKGFCEFTVGDYAFLASQGYKQIVDPQTRELSGQFVYAEGSSKDLVDARERLLLLTKTATQLREQIKMLEKELGTVESEMAELDTRITSHPSSQRGDISFTCREKRPVEELPEPEDELHELRVQAEAVAREQLPVGSPYSLMQSGEFRRMYQGEDCSQWVGWQMHIKDSTHDVGVVVFRRKFIPDDGATFQDFEVVFQSARQANSSTEAFMAHLLHTVSSVRPIKAIPYDKNDVQVKLDMLDCPNVYVNWFAKSQKMQSGTVEDTSAHFCVSLARMMDLPVPNDVLDRIAHLDDDPSSRNNSPVPGTDPAPARSNILMKQAIEGSDEISEENSRMVLEADQASAVVGAGELGGEDAKDAPAIDSCDVDESVHPDKTKEPADSEPESCDSNAVVEISGIQGVTNDGHSDTKGTSSADSTENSAAGVSTTPAKDVQQEPGDQPQVTPAASNATEQTPGSKSSTNSLRRSSSISGSTPVQVLTNMLSDKHNPLVFDFQLNQYWKEEQDAEQHQRDSIFKLREIWKQRVARILLHAINAEMVPGLRLSALVRAWNKGDCPALLRTNLEYIFDFLMHIKPANGVPYKQGSMADKWGDKNLLATGDLEDDAVVKMLRLGLVKDVMAAKKLPYSQAMCGLLSRKNMPVSLVQVATRELAVAIAENGDDPSALPTLFNAIREADEAQLSPIVNSLMRLIGNDSDSATLLAKLGAIRLLPPHIPHTGMELRASLSDILRMAVNAVPC